ncbi:MAG: dTDP-4-amino-4,6-dideoxygalactose transaminase [Glaciecola sp.]|jgi:dTDP-4-amino-4,6-dideoxygalactose transaminase
MIIGNGLIAKTFQAFEDNTKVIIFASGVSDSLCNDSSEFEREHKLLKATCMNNPEYKLVYFSSCSLSDPDRQGTMYVDHKLIIERDLKKWCSRYLILRLPAVIGKSNAAKTLPFVLVKKIENGESFAVWKNTIRYPIDADDLYKLGSAFIEDEDYTNQTINLAAYPYRVGEIVKIIERIKKRKAHYKTEQKGSMYKLDLDKCYEKARDLNLDFDKFYLDKVLNKYLSADEKSKEAVIQSQLPSAAGGPMLRENKPAIYFGAPIITEQDVTAVSDCLRSRWIGKGAITKQFETAFAKMKGTQDAVALNSCTAALHLAMLALGVKAGDEVLVPTMTFCATAQAVELIGAVPILVDCDPHTYNVNAQLIAQRITSKTKAIIVVHLAGRCVEMEGVMTLSRQHDLLVIEDCAHALETNYKGIPTGLIGDAGCFSFYATKSITTGDGGMVIMRDNEKLQKVRLLSNHGMTTDAWSRVSRNSISYEVVCEGFKYNMTDMEAALGLSQLKEVNRKLIARKKIWNYYSRSLANLPIKLPKMPQNTNEMGYHLFSVVLNKELNIDASTVIEALKYENIGTGIHYHPLHVHPYFAEKFNLDESSFPNASKLKNRLFSLPLNTDLVESDLSVICEALSRILLYFTNTNTNTNINININTNTSAKDTLLNET